MARPLIGITTYVTPAKWSYWELEAALIPVDYVRAVERAGGRALLVPPSEEGVEETLQALDGLLFSGGSDLDPDRTNIGPPQRRLPASGQDSRCSSDHTAGEVPTRP